MSGDPSPSRIMAVDDHPLLRQGIAGLVADQSDMKMVAEASNGREAIQQFRTHRPDVTLMDVQMPEMNGVDAMVAIRDEFPEARISLHKDLLDTIRAVHSGKKTMSPEASFQLAEHATDDALTPAEIRVLNLIAAGNANKVIAAQLSISEETVKGQVRNILSKLGANDRTHAAMIGLKRGIIES
jgi:DNA-binding NarL/FixJ family response regulator